MKIFLAVFELVCVCVCVYARAHSGRHCKDNRFIFALFIVNASEIE